MSWFAVRGLYLHASDAAEYVYEERIKLYEAASPAAAFELAQAESATYLRLNPGFSRVGEWVCFVVRGEDLRGAEVWSGLLASSLPPTEFYAKRYTEPQAPFADAAAGYEES
jgi:hypothetical protein